MRHLTIAAGLALAALVLGACGSSPASTRPVPALGGSGGATGSGGRAGLVHATAVCLRTHGIPGYQEPVIAPGGDVYSDTRSIQDASQSAQAAARHACSSLAAQAGFDPTGTPPAPAALVTAGVRSSECLRANGLPNVTDPTAQSPWTPGHGFGFTGNEIPAGGKQSPAFQQATTACRAILDAEIRASTLSSLANG